MCQDPSLHKKYSLCQAVCTCPELKYPSLSSFVAEHQSRSSSERKCLSTKIKESFDYGAKCSLALISVFFFSCSSAQLSHTHTWTNLHMHLPPLTQSWCLTSPCLHLSHFSLVFLFLHMYSLFHFYSPLVLLLLSCPQICPWALSSDAVVSDWWCVLFCLKKNNKESGLINSLLCMKGWIEEGGYCSSFWLCAYSNEFFFFCIWNVI